MSNRPDAYMPFYTADWLRGTMRLSHLERDVYLLLCIEYWDRGGPIANDDAALARIARCTPAEWKRTKVAVKAFFAETTDANGAAILVHRRLNEILAEAERKYARVKAFSDAGNAVQRARGVSRREAQRDTHGEPRWVSQSKPKPNKSEDLSGAPPRAVTGAASPPPLDASWNGIAAVLEARLGTRFAVYCGGTRLEPPATIVVSSEFRKGMIERSCGLVLRSVLGDDVKIRVVEEQR